MAEKKDGKKTEKKFAQEEKLGELLTKFNGELADAMAGRPYLMVVTTGYEIGKDGEKSLMAAQWGWRSNVFLDKDEGKRIMEFLLSQLKDAETHPENGVKKQYRLK